MQFGLFGSAQAKRGGPDDDSGAGFREFVERNIEAEALGYVSTFLVEHHFTGFGQVSASLNLLTWIGARTTTLRLGTAVLVLPWHNPVLLAEVLSDSTEGYDRGKKSEHYRKIPLLREYLFLNQKEPHVELFFREKNQWILREVSGSGATLELPGLQITVSLGEIYANVSLVA